jgi:hypothetical protein
VLFRRNKAQRVGSRGTALDQCIQVAGFAHVIGSLWDADDAASIEVTRNFYTTPPMEEDPDQSRDNRVALSLNRAINAAIIEDPEMPLWWANYVHYGP